MVVIVFILFKVNMKKQFLWRVMVGFTNLALFLSVDQVLFLNLNYIVQQDTNTKTCIHNCDNFVYK